MKEKSNRTDAAGKSKHHPSLGRYTKEELERLADRPLRGVRTLPLRKL